MLTMQVYIFRKQGCKNWPS